MSRFRQLETETLKKMIILYCNNTHHPEPGNLCADCEELFHYAQQRIDKCIYGENKPVCSKCTIHCYKPEKRAQIKKVMQFSGPRMLLAHPCLAVRHLYRSKLKSQPLETETRDPNL